MRNQKKLSMQIDQSINEEVDEENEDSIAN